MQSVLPHAATMHTDGNGDSRAVFAATGTLSTPSTIAAFPHLLAARGTLNANLQHSGHAQLQSQLSAPVSTWQFSSASTFAADTRTNLGESAALPAAMASGGGLTEVEVEEAGGGDDMASGLEAPEVAAVGSDRREKERARQKRRRQDPDVRAEENRKRRWRKYGGKHSGTPDYAAWKLAGEPTRPNSN